MPDDYAPPVVPETVAFVRGVPDPAWYFTHEHSAPIDPPHLGEFDVGAFPLSPYDTFPG